MRRAIKLALKVPEIPFGAHIVNRATEDLVAEEFNQSTLNPTFHAALQSQKD